MCVCEWGVSLCHWLLGRLAIPGEGLLCSKFLFILLLAHASLLCLEVVELVCDALLAHLDANDLHNFHKVVDVFQGSFLVDLSRPKLLARVLLARLNQLHVILSHEGERFATSACSSGAPDPMNVVLWTFGHVIIEDELDFRDVEAS